MLIPNALVQGRPKSGPEDKFRLTPVAPRLQELLGKPVRSQIVASSVTGIHPAAAAHMSHSLPQVKKLNDCVGEEVEKAVAAAKNGEVRAAAAVGCAMHWVHHPCNCSTHGLLHHQ